MCLESLSCHYNHYSQESECIYHPQQDSLSLFNYSPLVHFGPHYISKYDIRTPKWILLTMPLHYPLTRVGSTSEWLSPKEYSESSSIYMATGMWHFYIYCNVCFVRRIFLLLILRKLTMTMWVAILNMSLAKELKPCHQCSSSHKTASSWELQEKKSYSSDGDLILANTFKYYKGFISNLP